MDDGRAVGSSPPLPAAAAAAAASTAAAVAAPAVAAPAVAAPASTAPASTAAAFAADVGEAEPDDERERRRWRMAATPQPSHTRCASRP